MSTQRGRPKNGEDRKSESIINSAQELFVLRGYAGTSMDDVASHARASKTTLYSRFPSKAALFAAVIKSSNATAGMEFDPAELHHLPVDAALKEIARRFLALVCSPDALRLEMIYHSEAAQIEEVAAVFLTAGPQRAVALVEQYFEKAKALGAISVEDPHFAAVQFLVLLRGDPFGVGSAPGPSTDDKDRDAYAERIVRLLLNGIAPKEHIAHLTFTKDRAPHGVVARTSNEQFRPRGTNEKK